MTDDPYALDFFQRITDCNFGSNWIQVKAQCLTSFGGQGAVSIIQSFPSIALPTFPLLVNTVPKTSLPLFSVPITNDDLAATVAMVAGKKLTGFGRRLPATPPPTPPGGAAGYWFKIGNAINTPNPLVRIRFTFAGLVQGSWQFVVATAKDLRAGQTFDEPDFFSAASKIGSHSHGDIPPSIVDFTVDTASLQVTLL